VFETAEAIWWTVFELADPGGWAESFR